MDKASKIIWKSALVVALAGLCVPAAALAGSGPPAGVPGPTQVPGKEYSNHADEDVFGALDPMQNIAWDGTGNAWNTFDYDDATNITWAHPPDNVDAIANIQDHLYKQVVADQVALLATLDQGIIAGPATDYEDIYYQTAGAGSVAGVWAKGVYYDGVNPPTSDINTQSVQAHHAAMNMRPWINPTGIEVWGSEVYAPQDQGAQGTGDDANMFSTNGDSVKQVSVYKWHPTTKTVTIYLTQPQIQQAIGYVGDNFNQINLDAMMVYDVEEDGEFAQGDSIMFSIQPLYDNSSNVVFDGGEIWVWNFDDGPVGTATFLAHGGFVWDTPNNVAAILGTAAENIGGLEAVPEPGTLGLLALGGLALLRRRRK